MSSLNKFHRIRQLAGSRFNCPVTMEEGNTPPTLVGKPHHYTTRGGNIISHPSAYSKVGWSNMTYVGSTLKVIVGREWMLQNLTQKEIAKFVIERLQGERNDI